MSRVDVVVPCYNYGRFLRSCVTSVLSQRGVEVRVLIIDDCSSDDSDLVGSQLAREDARVEHRRHLTNRGHIATYNEGLLEWADGDYCLLLSADDMLAPGALERATQLMDARPDIGLAFGDAPKTHEPEALYAQADPSVRYPTRTHTSYEFLEKMCTEAWNIVPTPTAVVRTSIQKAIGGYRPELPHSGDMEMWLRCAAHAGVGVVDGVQAYYRLHREQMSVGYSGVRDFREVRLAFHMLFDQHRGRIREADALRKAADQALARRAFWTATHVFDRGDVGACQEYLDIAAEFWPELRKDSSWRRLQCKRALGPRLWSVLRPIVRMEMFAVAV